MGINTVLRPSARRLGLLAPVCGISMLLLLMGAAQAFAESRPDLLVSPDATGATYLGGGIFEASASSLQSQSQPAFPGKPASFRVRLNADQAGSFRIKGTGGGNGFTVRFLDGTLDRAAELPGGFDLDLAAGDSRIFLLQVTPDPDQIKAGASYPVLISAAFANNPDIIVDQVRAQTVSCVNSAAVTISTPPDGSDAPGKVVRYAYTVTNVGSDSDSFTLSADTTVGWSNAILAGDGVTSVTRTPQLAPGEPYSFMVAVTIPVASPDGRRAITTLSVIGSNLAGGTRASGTDSVTTSAKAATISVAEEVRNLTRGGAFAVHADALPGDTLEYRMAVTNSGLAAASSVGIRSAVPASTACLPGSLWIGSSASGEGSACAAELCGWVRESGGSIVAHLGEGATAAAGGSLMPGKTLYVYFRVRVE
jgi:uncharacterized repeat protein (TIGR01451 family)